MCIFQAASIVCLLYFIGAVVVSPRWRLKPPSVVMAESEIPSLTDGLSVNTCENRCRPHGSESLPEEIVKKVSNLEMRPLWGYPKKRPPSLNLLALSVGIKQKHLVNEMVSKFLACDFVIMLFHYDENVDDWKTFGWSDKVIHISVANQTKWWFAKRFLHPDILVDYEYVFLWDEDLGVEDFDPRRYLDIVKEEGLHISQPALDSNKSEVHHQITARGRKGNVHRRTYKEGMCYSNSTGPPCTGWIEVMAPVFSRSAWRCVWYMIQNDLIHAWGLDMHLGYCAQGDRTKNIGVVDAQYIVHYGLPTLGEPKTNKAPNSPYVLDKRIEVRRQSYNEYKVFRRRWAAAVAKDKCWKDPYTEPIRPLF